MPIVCIDEALDMTDHRDGRGTFESMWDDERIETGAQLRTVYRDALPVSATKDRPQLDEASRQFIERSRFMLLGTHGSDGGADVSPRGGPSGFVLTLDAHHLAIADLAGNNRLDSMLNIIDTGKVGLLFVVPGKSETVRVNGDAWITTAASVLERFELPRRPKVAIIVRVETTFTHCAKAFMRSGMWDCDVWAELADAPDMAQILVCQGAATMDEIGSRERVLAYYEDALRLERAPD